MDGGEDRRGTESYERGQEAMLNNDEDEDERYWQVMIQNERQA